MKVLVLALLLLLIVGCTQIVEEEVTMKEKKTTENPLRVEKNIMTHQGSEEAIFAGGCFWCMEAAFEEEPGVLEAINGYTGGNDDNPTYEEVSSGKTGHYEAVRVIYDSAKVSYTRLVELFWRQIDPTDAGGQFADRGSQYHTAIFYSDEEQKAVAEASKRALGKSGKFEKPIVTAILPAKPFYDAEEYHQDYYKKKSSAYQAYAYGSGRKTYTEKVWGGEEATFTKPSEEELQKVLSPLQFKVTQEEGTEPPFDNEYWNNSAEGIYVDLVSGEPLFSSLDKYKSGTGWPSFTKPLDPETLVEKTDRKLFSVRTEVRSKDGDNHLGHVFNDGPVDKGGLRYCMNSAALKFVPKEDLEKEGYGEYLALFNE